MDKIAIGKVRTSTGVRGYFKVLSFSGEFEHFKKLKGQYVEFRSGGRQKDFSVVDVRMSGSSLTVKVEGIDNPEDAKKLSGWEIYVDKKKAAKLKKGEYYLADLCRCSLVYEGDVVAEIKGVSGNGISDLLEIEIDGKVRLIPFLDQYVGEVNIKKETIELKEGWLLE